MSLPILATKLYIPPLRPKVVLRPRLSERLNEGLRSGRKLTLVSAPAGFGKTTLVSEWVQAMGRATPPVAIAWLSLDESDNDPTRFLTYFVAALQTVEAGIGETALTALQSQSSQLPPIEAILTSVINEVATIPDGFVFILDDYHLINTQPIHEALTFLLAYLPPQMHLVITTRSDPFFLPLPRLRARSQMTELRSEDLRFSTHEATDFLNRVMGLALSEDNIASLETRTEGWIAGLQLAGLSMQSHDDTTGFISAFAGDDRYIIDYLVDEVLAQRPQGTKDFLLQTSILHRMTGSLCDAVTGQEGGRKVLQGLERANLFIVPLGNRRRWYRYHHLFADLLRQRLEESTPLEEIKALHRRASQWYEENDFLVEAVEHALAAEDFDNVIRLIELGSMEILMQSQQSLLLRWQDEIPRELVASHPKFCMTIAWAWLSVGHPQEAEACLQLLEQSLGTEMVEMLPGRDRTEKVAPAIQVVLIEMAVMRMELAIRQGNISRVSELSRLVLPYLEDEERPHLDNHLENLRSVVYFVLGLAYKISGELSEADEALSKAAALGREQGNVHIVAGSVGRLASIQSLQGHLSQAVSICQRGLKLVQEMVGERSPVSGLIHAELGNLLYEQNNLEAALLHLQESINLAKLWGFLEAFIPGYTGLARVRAAQGDMGGAFAALDELAALGQNNPQTVMPAVESFRAKLWAAQGKVNQARRWAEHTGLDADSEIDVLREGEFVILARILMARKEWGAAARLIDRLLDAAETGSRWGRAIELLALRALVLDAQGRQNEALEALVRALTLAEPEGYVRPFTDQGEPMARLLTQLLVAQRKGRQAASQDIGATPAGVAQDYIAELLAAFGSDALPEVLPSHATLVEPLSERELEVLRLLQTALSGPEIARELTIALPTLRFHTRNIYGKLGVNNRRQAVARAESLGLLSC